MEQEKRPKNRWYTIKGHKVSVRFSDNEYKLLMRRASDRELSVGLYLKWLFKTTRDDEGILEVERWNRDDWEPFELKDKSDDEEPFEPKDKSEDW